MAYEHPHKTVAVQFCTPFEPLFAHLLVDHRGKWVFEYIFERYEAELYAVVDVMAYVGYLVRMVDYHRLQGGVVIEPEGLVVPSAQKRFSVWVGVLQYPLQRREGEIEPVELRIPLLEFRHHPERLEVVVEPVFVSALFQTLVERIAAYVTERGMPQIVSQRDGFGKGLVTPECIRDGPCDLAHLQ